MVTSTEEIYYKVVIHGIEKKKFTVEERCNLLIDFHRNGKKYYDLLCDYSYLLSTTDCDLSLWISPNGKPHLSASAVDNKDIKVMDSVSIPLFNGDLINFLNVALNNFEKSYAIQMR